MVFGNETSGKSSLLERLAMMPLLPRGDGTCTRLPIVLRLRHADVARNPVLVVRDSASGREEVRRTVSIAGGEVDVRREMERVIAEEHKGLSSVSSSRIIEVHVHSPAVPSIDLMDLPGLTSAVRPNEAPDTPARSLKLVEEQIAKHKESAVFLCTIHSSMAPDQSRGMKLVQDLGLEERTVGVFTMCDDVGKKTLKLLPARIEQAAGDASVRLEPHGFVATMTEPVEDESLTNLAKLRVQAATETSWFAAQPALAPLLPKGLLTCNALVDKVNVMYLRFLLDRWAPQTLFRLNREAARLKAESDALGLPEATERPAKAALKELLEKARDAAAFVLDQKMPATVQRCFDSLKPLQAQLAAGVTGGDALNALLLEGVSSMLRVRATYVSEVREALAADASAFQLGRFPAFIDAVVSRLAAQTSTGDAELVWRKQELGVLLIEAAAAVPAEGWVEACKAKRLELRARMEKIEPVKAKTLELLKVRAPSHRPSLFRSRRWHVPGVREADPAPRRARARRRPRHGATAGERGWPAGPLHARCARRPHL